MSSYQSHIRLEDRHKQQLISTTRCLRLFKAWVVETGLIPSTPFQGNKGNKNIEVNPPEDILTVGSITYDQNQLLGSGGSAGVFKGRYKGIPVAVKRVLKNKLNDTNREQSILSALSDDSGHVNVVKLIGIENDKIFGYLALSLCKTDFCRALQDPSEIKLDVFTLLEQALLGIEFIHSKTATKPRIVHRDIKPDNILIYEDENTGQQKVMLADYGLSKQVQPGKSLVSVKITSACGTQGWKAKELKALEDYNVPHREITVSVDIFSFGCVAYYMLSNGQHPFQNDMEKQMHREGNIDEGKYYLHALDEDKFPHCRSLIVKMITEDPEKRPTATEVLNGPMFKEVERGPLMLSKAFVRNTFGVCFSIGGHSCRFVQSFHNSMGATFFRSVDTIYGRDWYKKIKTRLDNNTIQQQDVIVILSGTHGELLSGNQVPTTALTDMKSAEYEFVREDKAHARNIRKKYPKLTIDIVDVADFHQKPEDLKKRIDKIRPQPKWIVFAFCNSRDCEDVTQALF